MTEQDYANYIRSLKDERPVKPVVPEEEKEKEEWRIRGVAIGIIATPLAIFAFRQVICLRRDILLTQSDIFPVGKVKANIISLWL